MYKSNIHHKKSRGHRQEKKREMVYPEEGQEYGFVQDMLGNGRVSVYCQDGNKRMGRICGSMRKYKKKTIIQMGDIILISRRDYEDTKVDVVYKYTYEEANYLSYRNELPEKINKIYQQNTNPTHQTHVDDSYIVFAEEELPSSTKEGGGGGGESEGASGNESDESIDVDAI